jgi:hypothetical protein
VGCVGSCGSVGFGEFRASQTAAVGPPTLTSAIAIAVAALYWPAKAANASPTIATVALIHWPRSIRLSEPSVRSRSICRRWTDCSSVHSIILSTSSGWTLRYSLKMGGGGNGNDPLNAILRLTATAFETLGSLGSRPMFRRIFSKAGGTISDCDRPATTSPGLLGGSDLSPVPLFSSSFIAASFSSCDRTPDLIQIRLHACPIRSQRGAIGRSKRLLQGCWHETQCRSRAHEIIMPMGRPVRLIRATMNNLVP